MNIFECEKYIDFIKKRIKILDKSRRGELSRIANAIGAHPSLVSQVLAGTRNLTVEQAADLTQYYGLTELESEYFYALVSWERAGNKNLKKFLFKKIQSLREKSLNLSERFVHEKTLDDSEKAIFYSSWVYSAIRLLCSTSEKGLTEVEMVSRLHLSNTQLREILEFLTKSGLVSEDRGYYKIGLQRTYVPRGSPFLIQHHKNWRLKAMQGVERLAQDELMFTCPMSISKADFKKIRETLSRLIEELSPLIKESPAEDIACVNFDLFWIKP